MTVALGRKLCHDIHRKYPGCPVPHYSTHPGTKFCRHCVWAYSRYEGKMCPCCSRMLRVRGKSAASRRIREKLGEVRRVGE